MTHLSFTALALFFVVSIPAQIEVLSTQLSPYNVTEKSVCLATLNSQQSGQVKLVATIQNAANEVLLKVESGEFEVNQGVTVVNLGTVTVVSSSFSNSAQGNFLKTHHRFSSGMYNHCIRVIPISGIEGGDEFCNAINAEEDAFLYLVHPAHKDTVFSERPLLSWTHSEPFNLLSEGEFFRMVVVKLEKNQDAQSAIVANKPAMLKNFVSSHQVPYPFDADELEPGEHYGWQVQKISNGTIINQTEAWEFVVPKDELPEDHLYVQLKSKPDGRFYSVRNDRIYFRYDEKYHVADLTITIIDDVGKEIPVNQQDLRNDSPNNGDSGYNRYCLDISRLKLKTGYYTLSVRNGKKETYQLNFLAQ